MADSLLSQHNIDHLEQADHDDETLASAVYLAQSCTLSLVLNAAVELNLFGIMASAGGRLLSAKEIAAQLPTDSNPGASTMIDRILRLLATHSTVSCTINMKDAGDNNLENNVERLYGLTPVSKLFVPLENEGNLGPYLALLEGKIHRASWSKLKDAVLNGGVPFDIEHGVNIFDYLNLEPTYANIFNKAMLNFSSSIMKNILFKYKGFEGINQLVDVGGGLGHCLHSIISKYPSVRGINFDLPHVIHEAVPYHVLHNWSDDNCVKLLKKCYNALPSDGKVIVVEMIYTEKPQTSMMGKVVAQMDLNMLTKVHGGKERSENEFLNLALNAGFKGITLSCSVGMMSVIEMWK